MINWANNFRNKKKRIQIRVWIGKKTQIVIMVPNFSLLYFKTYYYTYRYYNYSVVNRFQEFYFARPWKCNRKKKYRNFKKLFSDVQMSFFGFGKSAEVSIALRDIENRRRVPHRVSDRRKY